MTSILYTFVLTIYIRKVKILPVIEIRNDRLADMFLVMMMQPKSTPRSSDLGLSLVRFNQTNSILEQ